MAETILLIDDDKSLRRVTEYNLAEAGFNLITASSGREGLVLFKKSNPDLVITDVKLGDMDGLEVLAAIKRESPEIPVIVITSKDVTHEEMKLLEEDVAAILQKGAYTRQELLEQVSSAVNRCVAKDNH